MRKYGNLFLLAVVLLFLSDLSAEAATYHVTPMGSGNKTGADWGNALGESEFNATLSKASLGDVFWVAKGAYRPVSNTQKGSADISFEIPVGVKLYGGFVGNETTLAARDPKVNITVLTGDLAGDDTGKVNGATLSAGDIRGTNSKTVVRSGGADSETLLDGFTICGGNDGMYNYRNSNPTVTSCVFSGNIRFGMINGNGNPIVTDCTFSGSERGIMNDGCNPTIRKCNFFKNSTGVAHFGTSVQSPGALVIADCTFSENGTGIVDVGDSDSMITNSTFSQNHLGVSTVGQITDSTFSHNGTGVSTGWHAMITNCVFSHNSLGMDCTGGMPTVTASTFFKNRAAGIQNRKSQPVIVNCTFSENLELGIENKDGESNPIVVHCTFWKNVVGMGGKSTVINSIFWNNKNYEILGDVSSVTYCIVQGGLSGIGNRDVDPLLEPLADNGGKTKTHALRSVSSAIDMGTANLNILASPDLQVKIASLISRDQRGVERQGNPDIGAFEYRVTTPPVTPETPTKPESGSGGGCNTGTFAPLFFIVWVMFLFSDITIWLNRKTR